jgi:hypothetical protein
MCTVPRGNSARGMTELKRMRLRSEVELHGWMGGQRSEEMDGLEERVALGCLYAHALETEGSASRSGGDADG